jgi:hypothetical protein
VVACQQRIPMEFVQGADILGEGSWAQVVLAWNTVGACAATAQEQWAGSCASAVVGGGGKGIVIKSISESTRYRLAD